MVQRLRLIGIRIHYFRKLKGYTQLELAVAVGLSENYIGVIERGGSPGLTVSTLLKIADALGVELEQLTREEK